MRCIAVSDGERILGFGDQGAGGVGIPIGKMALYTALGGIRPEQCQPILLDVGTDNQECLDSPIYICWKRRRVRREEYDAFVDRLVQAVKSRWPHILLQWKDFAGSNASRSLDRYRDQLLCTFNDDIQGTAAVAAATVISVLTVTGVPLALQRIAVLGFGSIGLGITNLLAQFMQDEGIFAAGSAGAASTHRSLRPHYRIHQGRQTETGSLCERRYRSPELCFRAMQTRNHSVRSCPQR